jgi:hypothetical protein
MTNTITHHDRAALIKSGIAIEHGKATLHAEWLADRHTGATEGRFVMQGPSGRHSLMIAATDTERLAAHWRVFCEHEANR